MVAVATPSSSADGVAWDLGDLFAGADDPRIEASLATLKADAEAFATEFRGTIHVEGGPAPAHLLAGLLRLEEIYDRIARVSSFATLLYNADTANQQARDLQQRVEQRTTGLRNLVLFFDLEWLAVDAAAAERVLEDPALAPYAHYLRNERRYAPHTLSEAEEKIVNEKDVTGPRAWGHLFSELTNGLTFPVTRDGEVTILNLSQVLALSHEPDRALRRHAEEVRFEVLARNGQVLTFIYDTLVQDHLTMDRLRHYASPMLQRHLSNEVPPEAVERMMEVTEQNYPIAHDYFRLKARLLNLPRMATYDQYAPLQQSSRQIGYAEARQSILTALDAFSPRFGAIAAEFFDRNWIDAELRPAKRGGAFCLSPTPRLHPYILCNYTDNIRDAVTVAHELGHGLHGYLSRQNTLFNYHSPLPLAETASVFAEMLVFDHLVGGLDSPAAQLPLVTSKIEDIFATVFRQNVMTRYEQGAFARRQQGRLTPEVLGDVWMEVHQPYYADALEMPEGYRWGWSYIPHFINSRFYCYSYTFGELLVLALYALYRREGQSFVPRYVDLLSGGGSRAPEDLLAPLGVDFRDPDFWQLGFAELRRLVDWAKELAAAAGV
ncbi:MAG: M3 family oligoendopeptidase [Chloroflexota bacterium]